ncbi:juvenile hormone esterase-like, partial [Epargyreus clarus]|uniref:juvenile hormone esterase-like n=1 Tax=Epargyreus clarus TaxID=520877 RepID=UPI003C2B4A97
MVYRTTMSVKVVLVHLLIVSGVVARTPRGPLARHRDVVTTQGKARGYFAPRPPHYAYLGLPYARPPTHARFKAPKPPPRWDGIFEATHRIKCPQPDGSGTEDCLVVNVFSPDQASGLPVLVLIHDGGFQRGWGLHKAPGRLLLLGVVVVTFNYRLGAPGFLCLQTAGIPGNAGLKDQVAALYWVHRNIAKFGGNPHDVTLYGTGSGGVAVELLLLSELTRNLVHKAIIESGAVLSPSSMSYDPFARAVAEAINLGYKGKGAGDVEIFYNKMSIKDLVLASRFYPCVENNLLSNSLLDMDPLEILNHGIYQHVPLLISYTDADEISLVTENLHNFNTTPHYFGHLLPTNLAFETEDMRHKIAALVKDFYFEEYELLESVVQNYIDYINDIFMDYPITKSTTLHAA